MPTADAMRGFLFVARRRGLNNAEQLRRSRAPHRQTRLNTITPRNNGAKCHADENDGEHCGLWSVERSARMAGRHLPVIAKRFAPQRTTTDAEGLTRAPRLGGGAGEPLDKSLLRERFTGNERQHRNSPRRG